MNTFCKSGVKLKENYYVVVTIFLNSFSFFIYIVSKICTVYKMTGTVLKMIYLEVRSATSVPDGPATLRVKGAGSPDFVE